ncbi:MAG: exopolyphosphatase [Eggerthellaceae bacterium]|nr:exopolyphosphatase [Eggerthellaceae bacterium]
MDRYSVIDTGSNTVRLVAYDVRAGKGAKGRDKLFTDAVNEKKTPGLATYVEDGVFSEAGIAKTSDVLQRLLEIAENVDSKKTRIFATAVLRNCTNSAEAVAEIEERIGKKIDVLSAEEEAHLGYVGATCTGDVGDGTLIDIGGGSTELTRMTPDGDRLNVSLGQGSVSSYSDFVSLVLPTAAEIKAIAKAFGKKLKTLEDADAYSGRVMYGIGGSARAVSKMGALMFGGGVKPKVVTADQLESVFRLLGDDPGAFAHMAVRAVPDRLHSLIPGCTILRACMQAFGAEELRICKYGVREGYLLDRMLS